MASKTDNNDKAAVAVERDDPNSSDDSDDDTPATRRDTGAGASGTGGGQYDRLEFLKREKRLAMNRECARARRRRKKVRMEMLENRVAELNRTNQELEKANASLVTRATQLEAEIQRLKALQMQQSMVLAASGGGGGGLGMNMGGGFGSFGSMGAGAGGYGGFSGALMQGAAAGPFNSQAYMSGVAGNTTPANMAGDFDLQRRAALVGLGGGTTGLRGLDGDGKAGDQNNGKKRKENENPSEEEQARYNQLFLQARFGQGAMNMAGGFN